jgi:hypothetical protein
MTDESDNKGTKERDDSNDNGNNNTSVNLDLCVECLTVLPCTEKTKISELHDFRAQEEI